MNVSIRQLRAFVAVAESGSFTVAAQHLHVTQSALSLLIKDLESELGIRLFDRTTRSVRLTEVGHAFLPPVTGVLEDLERAVASVADLRDVKRGVARIDRDLHAWSKDLKLRPTDEVTYLTTALSLVSSGLGVTASPGHVRRLVNSFGLHMRAIVEPKMVREFCVFLPRRRTLNPAAASLLECLQRVARAQ